MCAPKCCLQRENTISIILRCACVTSLTRDVGKYTIIMSCFTSTILILCTMRISMLVQITRDDDIELSEVEYFTNTWAVRILGGPQAAERIAKNLGFEVHEDISEKVPNIYLFVNAKYPSEAKYASKPITKLLKKHSEISWVEQQIAEEKMIQYIGKKSRPKIDSAPPLFWDDPETALQCPNPLYSTFGSLSLLNLNDKYWPSQTYIKDCNENSEELPQDLNLAPVWVKHRLFGKGIKVLLLDSGIEKNHPDLIDNYDPTLGLDLVDNDKDPEPHTYRPWYPKIIQHQVSHGTYCAGVIGMAANNTVCGVGIAPLVTLGAVRLLGLTLVTDYKIATALLFKHVEVHISSNSWGMMNWGKKMPIARPLTRAAFKRGVTEGRQGMGLIYVFAAGNEKLKGDNCGYDPFVSSIYTISVASCNSTGQITKFSERCPGIMVTTYNGRVSSSMGGDKCITYFNGTSASAPIVSGAVALALEANWKLSWRDIQHLIAWTCQVAPLQKNPAGTWMKNGAGFYVSHDFGFGMLNINDLVEEAKEFHGVGPMHTCVTTANLANLITRRVGGAVRIFTDQVNVEITTDGCKGLPAEVAYLEHVQLTVTLGFPRRGDLRINLISPSGTEAKMLDLRPRDSRNKGLRSTTFGSVMTWGESPMGTWTICINGKKNKKKDHSRNFKSSVKKFWSISNYTRRIQSPGASPDAYYSPSGDHTVKSINRIGKVYDLTLTFHGNSQSHRPKHYKSGPRPYYKFILPKL